MVKVHDKWLRLALIIIPSALFLYDFVSKGGNNIQANIIYILTTILACEGSRWLIYRSRKWFKAPGRRFKRMITLIPAGILFVTVIFSLSKIARNYLAYGSSTGIVSGGFTLHVKNKPVQVGLVASALFYAIFTFLFLLTIYEIVCHFAKLRYLEKERDRFEREKLQAELQQLKGIVNPHFLFNNLNSLSALITENPAQAESFLDELTKVFRYLLQNNETVLTTLQQEMEFIHSYYHLLQTRYGKGISMQVNIDKTYDSYLLPPLTLQLLVENAAKHNKISKEDPLRIEIFNNGGSQLIVRNNISPREQSVESTGIGLRSIHSRYTLLNQEPPVIRKDGEFFNVLISLIPQKN